MAKINTGRMFLAGLSAGLVVNVGEIIPNVFILAEDWELANVEAGLPASEGAGMIFWYIVPGFLLGITGVWIYAAIRPR